MRVRNEYDREPLHRVGVNVSDACDTPNPEQTCTPPNTLLREDERRRYDENSGVVLARTTRTSNSPRWTGLEVAEDLFGNLFAGEAELLGEGFSRR